jgi:hypothetical protein
MIGTGYLSVGTGIASLGAAVLLFAPPEAFTATSRPITVPEIQPAAQPIAFNFGDIYPWVIGLGGPDGSTGAAAWNAALSTFAGGGGAVGGGGTMQTANQFGPLTFDLNSIRAFSASQLAPGTTPPGGQPININAINMDQWALGLAGLASSTGVTGWTADSAFGNTGGFANYAGVLQTANRAGPFVFDLNVLKALSFSQATDGTVLNGRQPDNVTAVDIGRWTVGIPGLISNTGTTGFVSSADFGAGGCKCLGDPGPAGARWVGGLQTTTQIGPMVFDFNFLPAISASDPPTAFTFGMAPDLTAANTPFAASSPPPPGTVTPLVSDPAPAPAPARLVSDPSPADPIEDTPKPGTSRISATTTPKPEIPGVNGAPLATTPKTGTPGSTKNPFSPFTDMFNNGIAAFTGTLTGAPSSTGTTTGDNPSTDGPGASGESGTGESG